MVNAHRDRSMTARGPAEEGVRTPWPGGSRTATLASDIRSPGGSAVRLFNRKKKPESDLCACPRCAQLVEAEADECPMCGWDLSEAYRGGETQQAASG